MSQTQMTSTHSMPIPAFASESLIVPSSLRAAGSLTFPCKTDMPVVRTRRHGARGSESYF